MRTDRQQQRRRRIRARLSGTAQRPRAVVFRSNAATSVQLIDDEQGHTMLALRSAAEAKGKTKAAHEVGSQAGKAALALGITEAVFDRGGSRYHGRVKAVAEGMREAGVKL
jgi:large subunit ribosomal protein L18